MHLLGGALVALAVFIVWRVYSSYLCSEKLCCEAFLFALSDMREKMKCYMSSPREWAEGYSSDKLASSGFIGALCNGESLADAYEIGKSHLQLSRETDEVLCDLFSRLGGGYLEGELMALDSAIAKLSAIRDGMQTQNGKRTRAVGALLGAIAAGAILLAL